MTRTFCMSCRCQRHEWIFHDSDTVQHIAVRKGMIPVTLNLTKAASRPVLRDSRSTRNAEKPRQTQGGPCNICGVLAHEIGIGIHVFAGSS